MIILLSRRAEPDLLGGMELLQTDTLVPRLIVTDGELKP